MIYLDYSATTKTDDEVLRVFNDISINNFANANSSHKIGLGSKLLIEKATDDIAKELNVKNTEIIYTSGASESNNMALKGIANRYKKNGMHIITTKLEHSSIVATLNYLATFGFEIEFVDLLDDGTIDINHLKKIIRNDTILVTISAVDSELGIRQPIEEIGKILNNYPNCYFHTDMTQCLGKTSIDLSDVDLASFSAHKIYCFKGIGGLYKKEDIVIEPIIHGGKSTTIYRSGTPQNELIVSMATAIKIALSDLNKKYDYVKELNNTIIDGLKIYDNVRINSTGKSIPHILNISVLDVEPEYFQHALDKYGIYISTKSACAKSREPSISVLSVTKDEKRAHSSIRISLSYKTTKEEVTEFLRCFKLCYEELDWK